MGSDFPFVSFGAGRQHSREEAVAAYEAAKRGEPLTREQMELAVAYAVHPLNGPLEMATVVVAAMIRERDASQRERDAPYMQHFDDCDQRVEYRGGAYAKAGNGPCTCGLDAIRSSSLTPNVKEK